LTGLRFGRLVVLHELPVRTRGYASWCTKCDCGNEQTFTTAALTSRRVRPTRSCGCLWKKPKGHSARNRVMRWYIRNARSKNRPWALSNEQFTQLTQAACHYCGQPPKQICEDKELNGSYIYNGIDRKDDSQGYVWENVVSCCRPCNWAKRRMPYAEFMDYIRQLVHYHTEKGTFEALNRKASAAGGTR
jgi:hypothetical protein